MFFSNLTSEVPAILEAEHDRATLQVWFPVFGFDESTVNIVLIDTSQTLTCKSIRSVTAPASCITVCSSCNHSLDSTLDSDEVRRRIHLKQSHLLVKVELSPLLQRGGSTGTHQLSE